MNTLLLCGKKAARGVMRRILPALCGHGGVLVMSSQTVCLPGRFETVLVQYEGGDCLLSPGCVAIFCRDAEFPPCPPPDLLAVTANDPRALRFLAREGLAGVTCGGERDTLCFSAHRDTERLLLSLQRSLHTPAGRTVEPCEFRFCRRESDDETVLLSAAALLLCGIAPEEMEFA